MKQLLAALLVVMAGVLGGVSVASAGAPTAITESANHNGIALQVFDGLQNLIERIDRLLESLVDLLETLQQLFGGEAGGD